MTDSEKVVLLRKTLKDIYNETRDEEMTSSELLENIRVIVIKVLDKIDD